MKRRCLFWLLAVLCVPLIAAAASRPNIVVILADDLGWGDPRCYNPESRIPTPAMDRLAAEGLRFTDMHSPSAVCTPTRYGLMTGRYAWRTRLKRGVLVGWSTPLLETNRMTLPALLKSAGYATGGFGKWHLGLGWPMKGPAEPGDTNWMTVDTNRVDFTRPFTAGPLTAGFDQYFGIPASLDMDPYVWVDGDRCAEAPTRYTPGDKSQRVGGGGFYRAGPIAPGFEMAGVLPEVTSRAVRFIEAQATSPKRRPFFAYVPLPSPHDPWLPHAEYMGKSGAGPRGDFVAMTDACVARILAALDRNGLSRDTLVVFTSDNGGHWLPKDIEATGHRANGPWRGQKSDIHEAGHRVPFIVRWPGHVKPGSTTGRLTCLVDLMATFAEITGVELPREAAEDSISFAGLLKGARSGSAKGRTSLVLHSGNGVFALRHGPWKYVDALGTGGFTAPATVDAVPGGPTGQLYNLEVDPGETQDRFTAEPGQVKELRAELEWIQKSGRSRR